MKKIFNTDLSIKNVGESVELYGWVQKSRDLGGLIFVDLRDRSGIIQIVISPDDACYDVALSLKNEYVIKVTGKVVERSNKNLNIPTGEIEIDVSDLEILNTSLDIPFTIDDDTTALEDTRLAYRYLDLRRNKLKNNLLVRSNICYAIREYLNDNDFVDVETPILCKSTPEGARDYLVPSRVNKGSFYALPQSPQLFKQLLMVSGIERYYQIAKCFRDEDLRADRQPEFTQLDLEMSFVTEDDIMNITEGLLAYVFKKIKHIDIKLPLLKMKYDEAIELYGSDKPDLRFDMKLINISEIFKTTEFSLFKDVLDSKGIINCLVLKEKASKYSRKDIDKLTEFVKKYGAKGLCYLKYNGEELTGSIANAISDEEKSNLLKKLALSDDDLVFVVADSYKKTKQALGALRVKLGKDLNLYSKDDYKLLWVTDFPLFEYSEEEKRYVSSHHPFTAPREEDIDKLISDKGNCYSKAYDIVINGYEAGGGSIRIHDEKIQNKMFEALELTKEDVTNKFGFFVEALKYGTPPHGGIALGLDRLTMLLTGTDNIKDVIAFPKTASAACLMSKAPNKVDDKQLKELGIDIIKK